MLQQAREDRERAQAPSLVRSIVHQATRHKGATKEQPYLLHDLEVIEERAEELLALLEKYPLSPPA